MQGAWHSIQGCGIRGGRVVCEGQSTVLSTRSMQHFQLDVPCIAVCGVRHSMPTRSVAHGARCTACGSSWVMHRAGHTMHRGQCTGLDTHGPCHSSAQCITQHPNISLESSPPPHRPAKPPWALPGPAQPPWRYLGRHPEASSTLLFQAPGVPTPSGDAWRLPSLKHTPPTHIPCGAGCGGGHGRARGTRGPHQQGSQAALSLAGSRSRQAHLV